MCCALFRKRAGSPSAVPAHQHWSAASPGRSHVPTHAARSHARVHRFACLRGGGGGDGGGNASGRLGLTGVLFGLATLARTPTRPHTHEPAIGNGARGGVCGTETTRVSKTRTESKDKNKSRHIPRAVRPTREAEEMRGAGSPGYGTVAYLWPTDKLIPLCGSRRESTDRTRHETLRTRSVRFDGQEVRWSGKGACAGEPQGRLAGDSAKGVGRGGLDVLRRRRWVRRGRRRECGGEECLTFGWRSREGHTLAASKAASLAPGSASVPGDGVSHHDIGLIPSSLRIFSVEFSSILQITSISCPPGTYVLARENAF